MKIEIAWPPNITKITARFGSIQRGVIFTYGSTIYNPDNAAINDPLLVHEGTHMVQQGKDIEVWWDRYLTDDSFRLQQEIEAYRNQYERYKELVSDRNNRYIFLRKIAKDVSGPMYGEMVSFYDAMKLIDTSRK